MVYILYTMLYLQTRAVDQFSASKLFLPSAITVYYISYNMLFTKRK